MIANRMLMLCLLSVTFTVTFSFPSAAQNGKMPVPNSGFRAGGNQEVGGTNKTDRDAAPPPLPIEAQNDDIFLSSHEFYLVLIVSLLGLLVFTLQFFLLRRLKNLKAEDMLRVFAVTLVLIGTVFFVSIGFGADQIAPAMGLFGTIAGYLLGRSSREGGNADERKAEQ